MKLQEVKTILSQRTQTWVVTGAAGFIGSHLVEQLLDCGQRVIGIDNFSNGRQTNLDEVKAGLDRQSWSRFQFIREDVRDISRCSREIGEVDFILHQAALGSVPRSIENPVATHEANVTGTICMLEFAREKRVRKFVFASSSSVYGDSTQFPQREENVGLPLSPYAVSKKCAELYGMNFATTYELPVIGLRYFNVFGPRQRPDGPYAAVIPRWVTAMSRGEPASIFGDGETSRDFCFVENVVKANLLAALSRRKEADGQMYNVTLGGTTSLNELYRMIATNVESDAGIIAPAANYFDRRKGDLARSQADISKAKLLLDYSPEVSVAEGLKRAIPWYLKSESPVRQNAHIAGAAHST